MTMNKTIQDENWARLTPESRKEVIELYKSQLSTFHPAENDLLDWLYGEHNLTSNAEPVVIYKSETTTKPENKRKNPQDLSLSDNQQSKIMNKELNLCELLKDSVGDKFFCSVCGIEIELKKVFSSFLSFYLDKEDNCTLECEQRGWQRIGTLDEYGKYKEMTYPNSQCIIYPSRALYEKYPLDARKAWSEWAESRKPKRWRAKDGEEYWVLNPHGFPLKMTESFNDSNMLFWEFGNYFCSKELCQQAAEEVRKYLDSFHKRKEGEK